MVEPPRECAQPADLTRTQMIAERQKRAVTWRIIHMLGSLKLALILLATIAIACAVATFAESSFDSKVAQAYIYKAPWFLVWLGVLCINLFAVTLTRWPWQRKHRGFIITHYGIILLLIGAAVGLQLGFEGNVTLNKEKPPVRQVTVNRSIIQVESPQDAALYIMPFDASIARPSEKHPRILDVPGAPLRIVVDAFSANLVHEEKLVVSEKGLPGVVLHLTSARMGQSIDLPLVIGDPETEEKDFFGLAHISFKTTLPASLHRADTQMIFGRFAPVKQSDMDATGVQVLLSEDGTKVTIVASDNTSVTYRRSDILKMPIAFGGAVITLEEYWPDFEMRNGQPATKSNIANNPAALIRIRSTQKDADAKPQLILAPDGEGVAYQLQRMGTTYASGQVKRGEAFDLGWADWRAEITQFLPNAAPVSLVKPGPPLAKGEQGVPGFRARLESPDVKTSEPCWVESGRITTITDGKNVVRIGYGLELRPLPFSLRLLNFEVPRYEGTETPSNFIATIEFENFKTGEKKTGIARMNHPASFPGTFLANLTGVNYKFSQAEWNPRDLGETTLQILYDPGWMFKWMGSLGICIGIAIMFYFKPKTK